MTLRVFKYKNRFLTAYEISSLIKRESIFLKKEQILFAKKLGYYASKNILIKYPVFELIKQGLIDTDKKIKYDIKYMYCLSSSGLELLKYIEPNSVAINMIANHLLFILPFDLVHLYQRN